MQSTRVPASIIISHAIQSIERFATTQAFEGKGFFKLRIPVRFINAIDLYLLLVLTTIHCGGWFSAIGFRTLLVNSAAFVAYHLSRTKRRASEQNLSQIFGGKLSNDRMQNIVKSSF